METTVLAVYFFLMNSFTPAPKAFRKGKTEPNHSWKWEYVGQMPSTVKESSGLAFIDGFVYTHGDSGQKSELWKFSLENLKEIKKISIPYYNQDWEDICFVDDTLYISDAGNNLNERLSLNTIAVSLKNPNKATWYSHQYEDQKHYPAKPDNKNFDSEAIFAKDQQLYLISKNRSKGKVKLYHVPKVKKGKATVVQHLPVDAMVTGADYNPINRRLAVLTYAFVYEFLWVEVQQQFIPIRKKKHSLKGQTEGICYIDSQTLLISNEKGKLYLLKNK